MRTIFDGSLVRLYEAGLIDLNVSSSLDSSFSTDSAIFLTNGNNAKPDSPLFMDGDDHGDTAGTATAVARDVSTSGVLETESDVDWFSFSVVAGQGYQIRASSDLDGAIAFADLQDADLAPISATQSMDPATGDTLFSFTSTYSGTAYFVVQAIGIADVSYDFVLSEVQDDFASDVSTTGAFPQGGGTVVGELELQGDSDWFRIDLTGTNTIVFEPGVDQSAFSREITLYDANGTRLTQSDIDQFNNPAFFADLAEGTYFLGVGEASGFSTGAYELTAITVADDHTAAVDTAVMVDPFNEVTGRSDYVGDQDVFAFTLDEAQQLRIFSDGIIVTLLDSNGFFLAGGGGTEIITSLEAGTYFLRTDGNAAGQTYTLSAEVAVDDVVGDASTTAIAEVNGGSVSAVIDFEGDQDWFQIALVEGQRYDLSLSDLDLFDLSVSVVRADGTVIATVSEEANADFTEVFIGFVAPETGDFFLVVENSANGFFDGPIAYDFTISSQAVAADDFSADINTTGRVDTVSETLSGSIERTGDSDWFAIDVVAGQNYLVGGTPDVTFSLFDGSGAEIQSGVTFSGDQFSTNVMLFEALETGRYFIGVSEGSGFPPFDYTATVQAIPSDETGEITIDEVVDVFLSDGFDTDDYTIALTAGQSYYIGVSDRNILLELRDGNESFLQDLLQDPIISVAESGTYTIRVSSAILEAIAQRLTLSVIEVPDDESGDIASAIALSDSVQAFAHGPDDQDAFSLDRSVSESGAFRISVTDDQGGGLVSAIESASGTIGRLGETTTVYFGADATDTAIIARLSDFGFYSLSIEAIADDFGNTAESGGTLVLTGSQGGQIDFAGDTDTFAIQADAPGAFRIVLETDFSNSAFLNAVAASGLTVMAQSSDGGQSELIVFVDQAGTFAFDVSGDVIQQAIGYQISAEAIPDDHGNTAATATAFGYGQTVSVTPDYTGDVDTLSFTADAGDIVSLRLERENFSFDAVEVFGPDGEALGISLFQDETVFLVDSAGTYTITYGGEGADAAEITLEQRFDDYSDGLDTTGVLPTNGAVTARYDYFGDADAFAFSIEAGEILTLQTGLPAIGQQSAVLQILDQEGNLVRTGGVLSELTTFTLGAGDYVLVVNGAQFGNGFGPGEYTVRAISNIDDYDDGAPGTRFGSLELGGAAVGALNPLPDDLADTDAFTLDLEAGQVTQLRSVLDFGGVMGIGIFNEAGELLATNVDEFGDVIRANLNFTADVTGTYTVLVGTGNLDDLDTYTLTSRVLSEGTDGNDSLTGGLSRDVLIGGDGDDVLLGDNAFALGGFEGELYRTYQGVFGRAPDEGGFNAFLTELRLGNLTQFDVVSEFVGSAEFQATYGDLSDRDFVELLYANVLPGNEDEVGRAAFTAELESGRQSREDVVLEFVNSAEFVARTTAESSAFARNVAMDPNEFAVFRMYEAVFGREPDLGGFSAFTNALAVGALDTQGALQSFVDSPEFQATYGDLSNRDFVELLYTNVLPGNSDATGRDAFTAALDSGELSRLDVVETFLNSFEFISRTQDDARDFIREAYPEAADIVQGGAGTDVLAGGRGADIFVVGIGETTILDFTPGVDIITTDFGNAPVVFSLNLDSFRFDQAYQDGADAVLDMSSVLGYQWVLRLVNVDIDDLGAGDFNEYLNFAEAQDDDPDVLAEAKPDIVPVADILDDELASVEGVALPAVMPALPDHIIVDPDAGLIFDIDAMI